MGKSLVLLWFERGKIQEKDPGNLFQPAEYPRGSLRALDRVGS